MKHEKPRYLCITCGRDTASAREMWGKKFFACNDCVNPNFSRIVEETKRRVGGKDDDR